MKNVCVLAQYFLPRLENVGGHLLSISGPDNQEHDLGWMLYALDIYRLSGVSVISPVENCIYCMYFLIREKFRSASMHLEFGQNFFAHKLVKGEGVQNYFDR